MLASAQLYADGRIVEAACWAHARRKFYDIYAANSSPIAAEALQRIGALYAIEREIRGRPPDERARGAPGSAPGRCSSSCTPGSTATLRDGVGEVASSPRPSATRWRAGRR